MLVIRGVQAQFRVTERGEVEYEGYGKGRNAKAEEHYFHGNWATGIGRMRTKDIPGYHLEAEKSKVLYPIYKREGGSKHLVRDYLWHGRPQCSGNKRISKAQEHHCQVSPEGDSGWSERQDGVGNE